MAAHAEYPLGCPCIPQILDLPLTIPTAETGLTEGLIPSEDGEVFDFITAGTAAVRAVVADEGSIAKQEEVCVGAEESAARIASEAVEMPSAASCTHVREGHQLGLDAKNRKRRETATRIAGQSVTLKAVAKKRLT